MIEALSRVACRRVDNPGIMTEVPRGAATDADKRINKKNVVSTFVPAAFVGVNAKVIPPDRPLMRCDGSGAYAQHDEIDPPH